MASVQAPQMSKIIRPWIRDKQDQTQYTPAEAQLDQAMRRLEAQVLGLEGASPEGLKAAYAGLETALVDFAVERNDVIVTLTHALKEAAVAVDQLNRKKKAELVIARAGQFR